MHKQTDNPPDKGSDIRILPLSHVQNEVQGKMKVLSDFIKSGSQKVNAEDLKLFIRQESDALSNLLSPLNPSVILAEIWLESHTQYTVFSAL